MRRLLEGGAYLRAALIRGNTVMVHNLLINHLNLKKEPIEAAAHRCSDAVLKNQKQPLADVLQNRCF